MGGAARQKEVRGNRGEREWRRERIEGGGRYLACRLAQIRLRFDHAGGGGARSQLVRPRGAGKRSVKHLPFLFPWPLLASSSWLSSSQFTHSLRRFTHPSRRRCPSRLSSFLRSHIPRVDSALPAHPTLPTYARENGAGENLHFGGDGGNVRRPAAQGGGLAGGVAGGQGRGYGVGREVGARAERMPLGQGGVDEDVVRGVGGQPLHAVPAVPADFGRAGGCKLSTTCAEAKRMQGLPLITALSNETMVPTVPGGKLACSSVDMTLMPIAVCKTTFDSASSLKLWKVGSVFEDNATSLVTTFVCEYETPSGDMYTARNSGIIFGC
jgi:hypothetical protein